MSLFYGSWARYILIFSGKNYDNVQRFEQARNLNGLPTHQMYIFWCESANKKMFYTLERRLFRHISALVRMRTDVCYKKLQKSQHGVFTKWFLRMLAYMLTSFSLSCIQELIIRAKKETPKFSMKSFCL